MSFPLSTVSTEQAELTDVDSLIRLADQTVYLLWHIVKGREHELDLRRKLIHTSHVIVNGVMHIFVVAFGRLSYADPPDWVDKEGKDELQLLQGACIPYYLCPSI